jgi:hypothetical protein
MEPIPASTLEDTEIASMLLPAARSFMKVVRGAQTFHNALQLVMKFRVKAFLESAMNESQSYFDKDSREWTGFLDLSARSIPQIKKHMLQLSVAPEDRKDVKKLPLTLEKLFARIAAASAAKDFVAGVDGLIEAATVLEHSGRVYGAMVGLLTNIVVKKGKRVPEDRIKSDLKQCVRGLSTLRLWTRSHPDKPNWVDDGKETISKVQFFKLDRKSP